MTRTTITADVPIAETMMNGRTYQPANVYGAEKFKALRDLGYRLGLAWFQAAAIAAYIVEHHADVPLNELENRYGHYKSEAWYDRGRGLFWYDYYAAQPSRSRY
ncbi:hypothetical protein [Amycolatopsis dendrobii]|uniref:Uncharacterized protein n=1 Tax=Amycolatopsis dendrobii TaxID=2760662 RepID=A0A7W3VUK4_9PSEU|nr:hypothetical protein [Amycolatopsis dendrobii]MBB1153498.1 hypothetical protein [Amycolatopsis dendrobii]